MAVMPFYPPPHEILWQITAACNLSCHGCPHHCTSIPWAAGDISTAAARATIKSIARAGCSRIRFSGGEPLVRPDIFELAEFAQRHGIEVTLATNGTRIDDATADAIGRARIANMAIQIDGPDEQTHDLHRREPGSFRATLYSAYRLRERGIGIELNSLVAPHNFHRLEQMYRMACHLGVHSLRMLYTDTAEESREGIGLSLSARERLRDWVITRRDSAPFELQEAIALNVQHWNRLDSPLLPVGVIRPNGDVYCHGHNTAIGSILLRSFEALWNDMNPEQAPTASSGQAPVLIPACFSI